MPNYAIKVAKSGQKIAVYNGENLVKVIESSKDTFMPYEAEKYAQSLLTAMQQQRPEDEPSVTTPSEEQSNSIDKVVNQEPKGIGGPEVMNMVSNLKAQLKKANSTIEALQVNNARLAHEKQLEAKARRALAIAKVEAQSERIANTEEAIQNRVIEITAMPVEDIAILERTASGNAPFETIKEAKNYIAGKKVEARMYRQAAEEAMEDGDKEDAIEEENKAAYCEDQIKQAQDFITAEKEAPVEEEIVEASSESEEIEVEASDDEEESEEESEVEEVETDDEDEDEDEDEGMEEEASECEDKEASVVAEDDAIDQVNDEATGEAPVMSEDYQIAPYAAKLADLYTKIAEKTLSIAKQAQEEGEMEVAEEAENEAKEAAEKAQILLNAEEDDDMDKEASSQAQELADLYNKVASIHEKIAEDAENAGEEEVADAADQEAEASKHKAQILTAEKDEEEEMESEDEVEAESDDEMDKEASESDAEEMIQDVEEEVEDEPEMEMEMGTSDKSASTTKIASLEVHENEFSKDSNVADLASQLWTSKYSDLK